MNDLRNMLLVCGIPDIQNAAGVRPTQAFIDSAGFSSVDDFGVMRLKDAITMIKEHNSVPGQTARLSAVHQRKIQALIRWARDHVRMGQVVTAATWNAAAL
jgi:hypothetical protein